MAENLGKHLHGAKDDRWGTLGLEICGIKKINDAGPGMVTHNCNPSTWSRDRQIFEFEIKLAYTVNSRTDRTM